MTLQLLVLKIQQTLMSHKMTILNVVTRNYAKILHARLRKSGVHLEYYVSNEFIQTMPK
jgi:hypothetical protein